MEIDNVTILDLMPAPELFSQVQTYDIFSPSEVEREPITAEISKTIQQTNPQRIFVDSFTEAISQSEAGRMSEEAKQDLDRVAAAAQEMRELIDSLLNFSRLGRGEVRYEPIDLRSYVEACLRNLQGEIRNRHASIRIKTKPRTVQADPTLLKIALTNLLSNAIKFVPQGVRPQITVSASVTEDICRIEIDDNGIGISEEDQ